MHSHTLSNSPIVYYTSGNANHEWMLLIHAAFATHEMFQPQIGYFRDKYNILTLDIIGHEQSVKAQKGDSIDKMSAWIREILNIERIEKLHIVGISLGAVIAQDFANHYPEAVQSLACFGAYDINNFDAKMQKENGAAQLFMMFKAIFSIKWFAESNKKIAAYTPKAQNNFYETNIKFPKKSFIYLTSLNKMINVCQSKPRKYPLLIGCGRHDIPAELAAVKMWKKNEAEGNMVIFEGGGHCVNVDAGEEFNEVIEKFVTGEAFNI